MPLLSSPGSVSALLCLLQKGDHEAANKLWKRYSHRLLNLARKKLRGTSMRVADEEDVVQNAFDSFCRRAERGQFPDLQDRDGLWALLVILTARKAADQIRNLNLEKHGAGGVRGDSALHGSGSSAALGFDRLAGEEPTPDEAALLAEEVNSLLKKLQDRALRQVAVKKLEGFTNAEIAALEGCSVPTVERRLSIIRRLLKPD